MFKLPEEILKELIGALESYIEDINDSCEYWGGKCGFKSGVSAHGISVILHKLESGCQVVKEGK